MLHVNVQLANPQNHYSSLDASSVVALTLTPSTLTEEFAWVCFTELEVAGGAMLVISEAQKEKVGKAMFIQRMAGMLMEVQAVAPETDREVLRAHVALALDEATRHGFKTERLMGMYLLLRLADKVDPYAIPEYAAVLNSRDLAEDDKAHQLQMIRLKALL